MKTILLIALGGAIGSVARFLVGRFALTMWGADFPWGTFVVNVAGSLVIGIMAGLLAHFTNWSQDVRHFAIVGILGGFTTFSAFALDAFTLYERGAYAPALAYVLASVCVSILALAGGMFLVRSFAA